MNTLTRPLVLLACALALAACGDDPDTVPPPDGTPAQNGGDVPTSATVSTSAYVGYLNSLPPSETDAPLGVNNVTPPTSETDEPAAL
jgi:hypothetical protein